jgi:phosphoribosyl 1,2-cyclic phosphodiesterase
MQIGGLTITGFRKRHDAVDPISFIVEGNGVTVGVFTDIGRECERLAARFSQCHAAFLEANYCEAMLEEGHYPYNLKKRIRGGYGHLSNREALEVFMKHRGPKLSHLLLAHLSKDNNNPEVALDLFRPFAGDTHVAVASRWEESPVYQITASAAAPTVPGLKLVAQRQAAAIQMPLF